MQNLGLAASSRRAVVDARRGGARLRGRAGCGRSERRRRRERRRRPRARCPAALDERRRGPPTPSRRVARCSRSSRPGQLQGADRNGDGDQERPRAAGVGRRPRRRCATWRSPRGRNRLRRLARRLPLARRRERHASQRRCRHDRPHPHGLRREHRSGSRGGQAITPCRIAECDPRQPFHIIGRTVRFLTLGSEQGATDLDGDGDAVDLVIQIFDLDSGRTRTVGTVVTDRIRSAAATRSIPTRRPSTPRPGSASGPETASASTRPGARERRSAADNVCQRRPACARRSSTARRAARASPRASCRRAPTATATACPTIIDDCPNAGPADQTDTDGDGVGDVCDISTCGNDVRGTEICDGADSASCPACSAQCVLHPVTDPKAAVTVHEEGRA